MNMPGIRNFWNMRNEETCKIHDNTQRNIITQKLSTDRKTQSVVKKLEDKKSDIVRSVVKRKRVLDDNRMSNVCDTQM